MNIEGIGRQLERIAHDKDFEILSSDFIERWRADRLGVDVIREILMFMEQHPTIDYGSPGLLVHYMESFYREHQIEYEQQLTESIKRKPTPQTIWMLHRLLNGIIDPTKQGQLIALLRDVKNRSDTDQETREMCDVFLNRH